MNLWDRQPDEPTRWFDRFERFRQAGARRTLLGCINAEREENGEKRYSSVPGSWTAASEKWKWRERATAWDDYQRDQARKEEEEALRQRRKAHIAQAMALQGLGAQGMGHLDPRVFTVSDVIRLIESGVRQELLARGAPSEITEERRRELPAEQVDDNTLARIALEGSQDDATPKDDPQVTSHVQDAADGKSEPGNGISAE